MDYLKRIGGPTQRFTKGKLYPIEDYAYGLVRIRDNLGVGATIHSENPFWKVERGKTPHLVEEKNFMKECKVNTVTYLNDVDIKEISTEEFLKRISNENDEILTLKKLSNDTGLKDSSAIKAQLKQHQNNIKTLSVLMEQAREERRVAGNE